VPALAAAQPQHAANSTADAAANHATQGRSTAPAAPILNRTAQQAGWWGRSWVNAGPSQPPSSKALVLGPLLLPHVRLQQLLLQKVAAPGCWHRQDHCLLLPAAAEQTLATAVCRAPQLGKAPPHPARLLPPPAPAPTAHGAAACCRCPLQWRVLLEGSLPSSLPLPPQVADAAAASEAPAGSSSSAAASPAEPAALRVRLCCAGCGSEQDHSSTQGCRNLGTRSSICLALPGLGSRKHCSSRKPGAAPRLSTVLLRPARHAPNLKGMLQPSRWVL
jgi:hypothetical protein